MAKSHKNKMNMDCYWAVGVMQFQGRIKFVTKTEYKPKTAFWSENEKPMFFDSKSHADEIALGLALNGTSAVVVEVPNYIDFVNPPDDKPQKPIEKMFPDDRFLAKVCPNCESSEIRNGDKFCKDCGQELDWS